MNRNTLLFASMLAVAATLAACEDKPSGSLAPTATALDPAPAAARGAKRFAVDKAATKL